LTTVLKYSSVLAYSIYPKSEHALEVLLPAVNRKTELTKRQEEVLEFIKDCIHRFRVSPTILEIQKKFFFKSPNAVQQHLKALERKGWIRRNRKQWRGLEVIGITPSRDEGIRPLTISVPLIGRVVAGSPILAEENIEGLISVDRSLVHRTTALFALHVRGDSMIKAGIYNDDIMIVQQQSNAENNDIVIALIGEEATVKRFFRKKNLVLLKPENDTMPPIKVTAEADFRILGKVVATFRKF